MKRWRWAIALTAMVLIGLIVAALKPPADDLGPFRPYALGEEHNYYQGDRATRSPILRKQPHESILMTFKRLTPEQLKAIALSPYYKEKGWQYVSDKVPEATLIKKDATQTSFRIIQAYRITDVNDPNDRDWVYLYETRMLSPFDIWVLRLRRIGRKTFDGK